MTPAERALLAFKAGSDWKKALAAARAARYRQRIKAEMLPLARASRRLTATQNRIRYQKLDTSRVMKNRSQRPG